MAVKLFVSIFVLFVFISCNKRWDSPSDMSECNPNNSPLLSKQAMWHNIKNSDRDLDICLNVSLVRKDDSVSKFNGYSFVSVAKLSKNGEIFGFNEGNKLFDIPPKFNIPDVYITDPSSYFLYFKVFVLDPSYLQSKTQEAHVKEQIEACKSMENPFYTCNEKKCWFYISFKPKKPFQNKFLQDPNEPSCQIKLNPSIINGNLEIFYERKNENMASFDGEHEKETKKTEYYWEQFYEIRHEKVTDFVSDGGALESID